MGSAQNGGKTGPPCSKEYAYADHDGAVLHLVLEEIYEVTDVSLAKDKSIMKKQIQEGAENACA